MLAIKKHSIRLRQKDGVYIGNTNTSYKKQGFGIFQALPSLDMYFGYWRAGDLQGLGLLVALDMHLFVYGEFQKGELDGRFIAQSKDKLVCGVAEHNRLQGIRFQYTISQRCWKMLTLDDQIIAQERHPIQQKGQQQKVLVLPTSLLTNNLSLAQFLKSYLSLNFFADHKVAKQEPNQILVLGQSQSSTLTGLACVLNKQTKECLLAGQFKDGQINGYAYRKQERAEANTTVNMQSYGFYLQGKKHGVFIEKHQNPKSSAVTDYRRGIVNESSSGKIESSFIEQCKRSASLDPDYFDYRPVAQKIHLIKSSLLKQLFSGSSRTKRQNPPKSSNTSPNKNQTKRKLVYTPKSEQKKYRSSLAGIQKMFEIKQKQQKAEWDFDIIQGVSHEQNPFDFSPLKQIKKGRIF